MGLERILTYNTTPDQLAADVLAELRSCDPLVVGADPISVGQVFRVAHAGADGFLPPKPVELTREIRHVEAIERARVKLREWMAKGHVIYGVNTGYGGTGIHNKALTGEELDRLQDVLINGLMASAKQDALPSEFVRGAMLQRVVSNAMGASGIRREILERLLLLLNEDAVPVVPLKGSLTASGDLVPLAYIAAVLQGEDDPRVEVHFRGERIPARRALQALNLEPIRLQPKEGLSLVNGTSVAAAAGCLVGVQALNIYLLTTLLTALAIATVRGTAQPYHPFASEVKPYAGQSYASRLIFNLLCGVSERLVSKDDIRGFSKAGEHRLAQLTYPFRCASQHLAPEFDSILSVFHSLGVEINSVSDNPLILADGNREMLVSSGNFLGSTVAREMDRMKMSIHSLVRLAHAQFKYLVRGIEHPVAKLERETIQERFIATHVIPLMSHPSDNMGFQGVEIYLDALVSEMNQRVGPHSTTYLSAEKDNQAIVSMGLAAARTAYDLATDAHYCLAAHLLILCQAFDLTTLEPDVIRSHESRRVNGLVANARAAELGPLFPLYDFVRRECQVPTLFTSTRLHTFLEPLAQRIANLDLLSAVFEPTIQAGLASEAFDQHSSFPHNLY
jgi:phenylalanine ammonia-lyase